MARLSAAQRRKMPASEFAGPNRSFPVNDANHARAALSMLHNAPPAARARIRAAAEKKLGKSKSAPKNALAGMK